MLPVVGFLRTVSVETQVCFLGSASVGAVRSPIGSAVSGVIAVISAAAGQQA
ncbi:hypothetical protein D3C81_2208150 [compost metagenome]